MKITMINASPNPAGTCAYVLAKIANRLPSRRNLKRFTLNKMNLHGCQECFSCRTSGTDTCYFMDDMPLLLESIKKTEYLIIASPVFFSDVSAQLKCVIDRTWSFFGLDGTAAHLPRNRKLLIILSYDAAAREQCQAIVERYAPIFREYGFDDVQYMAAYGEYHANAAPHASPEIERELEELFPIAKKGISLSADDIDLLENR
jgi:multimeric flavodoxin WrbA